MDLCAHSYAGLPGVLFALVAACPSAFVSLWLLAILCAGGGLVPISGRCKVLVSPKRARASRRTAVHIIGQGGLT